MQMDLPNPTLASPAVSCRDLHKTFVRRTVAGGYTTFKTQLVQWLQPRKYKEQLARQRVNVLKGISFEIMPGETVGIIGQNGAGKSTLLKLLTGIYKPTEGSITHHGRISALLELGAGFHPEFSGRENIYMNGMILGFTRKELRLREAEIIRFAEMEEFIDSPVRTYSSGMYMRLAFAIAVHVDPDILIIDEILAVGDEHFQHKSRARLDAFKTENKAIILVTHSLGVVEQWCTRAIWLEDGHVREDGDPRWVVSQYRQHVAEKEATQRLADQTVPQPILEAPLPDPVVEAIEDALPATHPVQPEAAPVVSKKRWGNRRATIDRVRVLDAAQRERYVFKSGEALAIEIAYTCTEPIDKGVIGIGFIDPTGHTLFGTNTKIERVTLPTMTGKGVAVCSLTSCPLAAHYVRLDVALQDENGVDFDYWTDVVRLDFNAQPEQAGALHLDVTWSLSGGLGEVLTAVRHEQRANRK